MIDYVRLNLTTEMIKLIQRLQCNYREVTIRYIDEDVYENKDHATQDAYFQASSVSTDPDNQQDGSFHAPSASTDPDNPYQGICLDEGSICLSHLKNAFCTNDTISDN